MLNEIIDAAKEIFRFRGLLKDIVVAAMNEPEEKLEKIFPIYEEFVEMVESFQKYTIDELHQFLNTELANFAEQPFFPVTGGLYVNALINRLFQTEDVIIVDIQELCYGIVDDASNSGDLEEEEYHKNEVNFSLDFLGYLLPEGKNLIVKGPVGNFCGALMGKDSALKISGFHGKHLGFWKHESAKLVSKD